MDQLEPMHGISADEPPPTVGSIAAVGDFHSAPRRGQFDRQPHVTRNGHDQMVEPDDEVVLSDIANVSLLADEGMSASAIATGLGLTAAEVLTDLKIAAEIYPGKSDGPSVTMALKVPLNKQRDGIKVMPTS